MALYKRALEALGTQENSSKSEPDSPICDDVDVDEDEDELEIDDKPSGLSDEEDFKTPVSKNNNNNNNNNNSISNFSKPIAFTA